MNYDKVEFVKIHIFWRIKNFEITRYLYCLQNLKYILSRVLSKLFSHMYCCCCVHQLIDSYLRKPFTFQKNLILHRYCNF